MIKIGITGGIGSGKSTVCRAFAQLGVPVYDSDSRARRLMNEDTALRTAVSGLFGDGAYDADGLNRKYVAGRIFSDGTLRERLNAVVHPAVAEDFARWAERQQGPYVIVEKLNYMYCPLAPRLVLVEIQVSEVTFINHLIHLRPSNTGCILLLSMRRYVSSRLKHICFPTLLSIQNRLLLPW